MPPKVSDQVPGNLLSRKGILSPKGTADAGGRELRLQTENQFYRNNPPSAHCVRREHELQMLTVNNDFQSVCDKLTSMSTEDSNSRNSYGEDAAPAVDAGVSQQIRDIAEVPAVEVITTGAVHLMSAAAVKVGLADDPNAEDLKDLDEARKLITALAGLVSAAAPEIGSQHAGPLRDGLRSLQLAFREASLIPDAPGKGPGEKFTGPVN
ncbi:conserved hypothetical protein [Paenarthrobacter aurescens TC1]|uniref:DUF1844 domain-containing protein n=2 Tax=Micrococcales TaxID=85006 RepID=A1R565_PAEAT|nr:conserved hypothetical protein [Paenarthrobacter aurescens TC1]